MTSRSASGLPSGVARVRKVRTGGVRVLRTRPAVVAGAVALPVALCVALSAMLVGCGTDSSTAPASSASAASTPGTTASTLVPLSRDALLTARQVPAWNGAMGWVEQQLPSGVSALTVCRLPSPESLGALQVLTRDFEAAGVEDPGTTPDPGAPASYAVNEVARFPDEDAAAAAVGAWEDATRDCASGLSSRDLKSIRISDLPTGSTWTASGSELSAECPECMRFDFLGFASKGAATTLVGFSLTGQDANYQGDPLAESMDAALARLP